VRRLVAVVVVLLGACATRTPAPTPTATPTIIPAPTLTETPAPTAPPTAAVKVGEWSAKCERVGTGDCEGVAALFVNNLARSGKSVFDQSDGIVSVEPRPECPALPDWADPAFCWQATAVVPSGPICMVVARQTVSGSLGFGQVGGDDLTGLAGGPPKGWPTCR
jgi:hypothetical protein